MTKRFAYLTFTAITLLAHCCWGASRPYGSGGCGLGSLVMGKDGNQVLAMTLNATGTQTFAISSGTSNCIDGGLIKKKKQVRAFIEINNQKLASEISKGRGETVSSLSRLLDCQDDQAFALGLHRHYSTIFPTENTPAAEVEHAIRSVIKIDLAQICLG